MAKIFNNILKISNIPANCRERYLNLESPEAAPLKSYGIVYSGISYLRKGYEIGSPNPPSQHMVIFTMDGEGCLITNENEYLLDKETLIVVPEGIPRGFRVKDDDWRILWFYMQPLSHWNGLSERGVTFSHTALCPEIENSMEAYLAEFGSPGMPAGRAAPLLAELICIYLDRALNVSAVPEDLRQKNALENLWKSVREKTNAKWDLAELAATLNVSPSTFQRLVGKYYSTTAWQKVIQIRMEQAKIMILNTDYPLKVIAEKLGYADEFVFSNAFKRYYGAFPRKYKKPSFFNVSDFLEANVRV